MDREQILALLHLRAQPDRQILLDDGEYFIEHSAGPPSEGNGFLLKRCHATPATPDGTECLGGYALQVTGLWIASIREANPSGEPSAYSIGDYIERDEAVAALWLARADAHSQT